ncbi:DUF3027 domain-containing protein [Arthrobacter bambusae]|jgi:hypothetical protein|uniref:DUF3027 domain-containing protein n=1 Tax=Arthrobacter TaxID=1663 RepID=UPI001F5113C0|nr:MULTISPECIES: DUF3027 domain-containing protein [Arthrobacter]MCI0141417.1 DUF3027 domain-containing protein [Arthrobacter bambusae]UYY82268.1 DUF3027 domain-containing protein [Arthrobacter sp. YA7-1]
MTSESAEASPEENGTGAAAGTAGTPGSGAERKPATAKPRTGIPVWRVGKPDAFLAAAVDVARNAVETIARPGEIGPHIAARSEGERVVTHLFESRLAGYGGWQWYAVVTRNSRSKVVTVSELGLLPSEDSILAPEWVPWAKRVRPEDEATAAEELAEEAVVAVDVDDDGEPSGSQAAASGDAPENDDVDDIEAD